MRIIDKIAAKLHSACRSRKSPDDVVINDLRCSLIRTRDERDKERSTKDALSAKLHFANCRTDGLEKEIERLKVALDTERLHLRGAQAERDRAMATNCERDGCVCRVDEWSPAANGLNKLFKR